MTACADAAPEGSVTWPVRLKVAAAALTLHTSKKRKICVVRDIHAPSA
jgi:hypothetical protein